MKGKKAPLYVSLVLSIVCVIGAVFFGINKPRNTDITALTEGKVTSIAQEQSGNGFFISGGTQIVYCDEDGNQEVAIDLSEQTGGERIYSLVPLEGTNRLLAYSDNLTAYLMEESAEGLELVGSFSYNGKPIQTAKGTDEFYVFYEVGNYCEIRAYDYADVSKDFVRRGILYNYGGQNEDGITLTLAKGLHIVYAFVENDKLYVMHEGGICMIDTSFSMNNFKYLSEEERVSAGVLSYNKNTYEAVVSHEAFDPEAFMTYTTGISAGTYHKEAGQIYFIANDRKLKTYPLTDLGSQEIGTDLQIKEVPDVVISDTQTAKPSMCYDASNGKGYITFDTINDLVCFDFNSNEVIFRAEGQFDVRDIAISSDESKVLLLYIDANKGSDSEYYLELVDAKKQVNGPLYSTLFLVCLIVGGLAIVMSIFFGARSKSTDYDEKVKKTLKKMWKHRWVYVILIPSLTALFMFCYYPGLASLGLSFFDYTAEKQSMKWNNFANYTSIFTNKYSLEAFRNMFIFAVTDVLTALIPPLIFAFFLSFMRSKKFSNFTRTMLFIPGVIPAIASALLWNTGIYGEYGVLNTLIESFGGEPVKFLASSGTALVSIIMMGFPFVGSYLIFYGAIMNIADSYIEAAELEGCPLIKRLIKIDIPLIMPQIKYVLIMTLIHTAQNFNRVYMTTGGSWGTQIPINDMYNKLVSGNYGQSSAYAAILFLIMFVPMAMNLRTQKKGME